MPRYSVQYEGELAPEWASDFWEEDFEDEQEAKAAGYDAAYNEGVNDPMVSVELANPDPVA